MLRRLFHHNSRTLRDQTSPKHFWRGHPSYWACQLLGWGCFWIFNTLTQLDQRDYWTSVFPGDFLVFSWALLLTHLYRQFIHERGWKELSWFRLWPRVAIASLVIGLFITVTTSPLLRHHDSIRLLPSYRQALVLALAGVGQGIVVLSWSAIYFGYQHQRKVRQLERDKIRLKKSMQESALSALQAQVNPHFLFNSLNVIRALIDEDNLRAREAVTQLATIFRASLQFTDQDLIPLRDELEIVDAYVALGKTRFQERLQVVSEIDPQTLDFLIPPFLIQNLVENAMKYGIDSQGKGGQVKISCGIENEGLLIQILNDGNLVQVEGSTGIGLANARETLRLLFGTKASLCLNQLKEGLVEARVELPQIRPALI